MKIMYFAADPNRSGSTLSLINLVINLKKKNVDSIIVFTKKGDIVDLLEELGIEYYIFPQYSWTVSINGNIIDKMKTSVKLILNFFRKRKLKKFIAEKNVDIVHINNAYLYLPCIAGKELGLKVFWHLREFMEEDQSNTILFKKYATKVFRCADKLIAISESIHNKYSKYLLKKENIVKIYNGISVDEFYSNSDHAFNNEKIRILLPATLMPEKGQIELLYAVSDMLEKGYNDIEVILAGRSVNKEYEEKLFQILDKLSLKKYVSYIGFQKDVNNLMKNSDIVCVCSKLEAFGRTTIEAMLSGCLVIGANTGGTSELIEDQVTGLLYNQGDYNDLSDKIIYSIKNKKLMKKIIDNGKEKSKVDFSADKNSNEIYSLYISN